MQIITKKSDKHVWYVTMENEVKIVLICFSVSRNDFGNSISIRMIAIIPNLVLGCSQELGL